MRLLKPSEINVKVKQIYNDRDGNKAMVLLHKDARVDMDVLDETFGPKNWQRIHYEVKGNLFCGIRVWDAEKAQWIEKQDVGIESNIEAEKGESSDSFKRAGTNWGIGRELYTAPSIWIKLDPSEITNSGKGTSTRFYVKDIAYSDTREIIAIEIIDGNGKTRFSWSEKTPKGNSVNMPSEAELRKTAKDLIIKTDWDKEKKEKFLKFVPIAPIAKIENLIQNLYDEGWTL